MYQAARDIFGAFDEGVFRYLACSEVFPWWLYDFDCDDAWLWDVQAGDGHADAWYVVVVRMVDWKPFEDFERY
jgi:hypothetical protein